MRHLPIVSAFRSNKAEDDGQPEEYTRPTLPPILFCALAFWLVSALIMSRGPVVLEYCNAGFVVVFAVSTVGLGFAYLFVRRLPGMLMLLIGAVAACACVCASLMAVASISTLYGASNVQEAREYTYVALSDSVKGDFGEHCDALAFGSDGSMIRVRLALPETTRCYVWDRIDSSSKPKAPTQGAEGFYWSSGLQASVVAKSATVSGQTGFVGALQSFRCLCLDTLTQIGGDGSSLLSALLLGYRHDLSQSQMYDKVKIAGVAHLVAVSGAHLALLVAAVGITAQALHLKKRLVLALQALFIVLFVILCGLPPSALRAAIMTAGILASFFCKRRVASLNTWSVCVVVLIAVDPFMACDISFCLSASATLSILLFGRYASAWFGYLLHGRAAFISDALGLTLASNLLTIPFSLPTFGYVSLVSPLANIIAAPFFVVLCIGGGIAVVSAVIFSPALYLVRLFVFLATLFLQAVELLSRIPYASVDATASTPVLLVFSAFLMTFIWVVWPRPGYVRCVGVLCALVVVFAVSVFVMPGFHGAEIVMLDVGQGDATLVRDGPKAVLIDTGTNDTQVLTGLAANSVHSLDAIIITHPDDDHCGSLSAILSTVKTDKIIVAQGLPHNDDESCKKLMAACKDTPVVQVTQGDTISFGVFSFSVLSPAELKHDGSNEDSIVLYSTADLNSDGVVDYSALFTGDAEAEIMDDLVQKGSIRDVDILKVGHHGSAESVDDTFLSVAKPEIALIGVGANNRYGHPRADTLEELESFGTRIFRTDKDGCIRCYLSREGIDVSCTGVE